MRISRPFLAPIFMGVIDISLDTGANARPLVGQIALGSTLAGGSANLQANQAVHSKVKACLNDPNLTVVLKYNSQNLRPVDIECFSPSVVIASTP